MSRSRLVARNVLTTLITQLLTWGLTFAVTLYLPRYIGATGLGSITLAGSFAAIFSLMVALGTSTVLIKDISRDREHVGEYVLAALALRVPLSLIAILLGCFVVRLFHYSVDMNGLIVLALVVMAVLQLTDVFGSALYGLEAVPRFNAGTLVGKIAFSLLTIALVVCHAALWTFVAVGIVSATITLLMYGFWLRPYLPTFKAPSRAVMKHLLVSGMPFLTTAIFVAIYGQSDAILLSKMSSIAAIGWYGLAKRLGGTTMMIPAALTSTMLPTLSRVWTEDRTAFDGAIRRLFNLMLICVVPFAVVLILAPAQVIHLLHYPKSFNHSIPVLILMGCGIILWYLSQAAGTALTACDRQAALSRITGVTALVSVPLCALMIYLTQRYMANGAVGAMASDILLEIYMVAAYIHALPAGLFTWQSFSVLGRATAAAVPFIAIFYTVHDRHNLYMVIPGLLLYIPLCAIFRCVQTQDMQMVKSLLRSRANA